MQLEFSFIIPVYNRPDEIEELLQSFTRLKTSLNFEIVIVEDGSTVTSENIINTYNQQLDIAYFKKNNTGPGDSRNFGMKQAKGNYFIILDSDCILPPKYLNEVIKSLTKDYVDCFGGPDASHDSFSNIQKAINFSMTSFLTTGGIRGNKKSVNKFQPRSFNMGLSKEAFDKSGGFGEIHPGEDPDLSIRLWNLGFKTKLIPEAYVFHKRRISWKKFYKQVNKFGMVRPILNSWHPETKKVTYWFPSLFVTGFFFSIILWGIFNFKLFLVLYLVYFLTAFTWALFKTKSLTIASLAILAICIQFMGYGIGFLKATIAINIFKRDPEKEFPDLFFKKT
ncbi:glycosyltransferase [Xanthomarina sp. F2636L]|uniref:glycosyltransferase n=1 Tax=Xanthomarina sp. F2636L TaxID=2996018 RepID=UPI00225E168C|nr:glycosyltransferase [Xanthomarina sp. F2636L]MCX7552184.1 glycosyltransferase [Xanthomarina sp. F2636L]